MSFGTSTISHSTKASSSLATTTSSATLVSSQSTGSNRVTVTSGTNSPGPIQSANLTGFPMPNITLFIDGTEYRPPLPGQDPLIIILSDSTTAEITDTAIQRDDVSLTIPSYRQLSQNGGSSSQQLSSWSMQFSTRRFQPSSCLLSIFECFKQAEADFTSAASSMGDSLASVGALMMQAGIADAGTAAGYTSEASSYSFTWTSLIDGMISAISNLEGASEALDGAMQVFNEGLESFTSIEMAELTKAGRIFSAYPEVSLARGKLSNLSNILKTAWANSPAVIIQSLWSLCQARWLPITSGGALITSVWGLHEISKRQMTDQRPVEERLHFILLERGFPISIFNIWTFALDQDRGTKTAANASVNDGLKQRGLKPAYDPGYTTKITIPKATLIRLIPFVRVVYLHPTFEQSKRSSTVLGVLEGKNANRIGQKRSFSSGFATSRKRELEESQAQMNLAAFSHHRSSDQDWEYTRDSSGGNGVTIIVPDSGATIDGLAWQVSRKARYAVQFMLTGPNRLRCAIPSGTSFRMS